MKLTKTISKLQSVVNKKLVAPKPMISKVFGGKDKKRSFQSTSLAVASGLQFIRKKPKIRNRLQKLIRKHFFN